MRFEIILINNRVKLIKDLKQIKKKLNKHNIIIQNSKNKKALNKIFNKKKIKYNKMK